MSDPRNLEIIDYIEPSPQELKAQKSRNLAIAGGLFGFVAIVFLLMLYKFDVLG